MTVDQFIPGETVETAVTFTRIRSTDSVTTATLELTIERPDGTVHEVIADDDLNKTITPASGMVSGYYRLMLPNIPGRWAARWTVTGDLADAYETAWVVSPSDVL